MITADEEVELSIRIKEGDEAAMQKLVVANLRFVISVAKQYQNKGLSFPDLINEGNLGLVKAATRFDEKRGFKFISYAVWWIRQSIMQAISEQTRIVRLPLNRLSSIKKINKAGSKLEQEFEREPTDNEIALFLNLTEEEVGTANRIKTNQVSFDQPFTGKNENEYSLYDRVKTEMIPEPDSSFMRESININIHRALDKLDKRESEILTRLYGLFSSPVFTVNDIAETYGTSNERVRQIRDRGIQKLREVLKDKNALWDE
jgi:RNA polymerase primary sigma factor